MIDITRTVVGQWYGVFVCLVAATLLAIKRHLQRQVTDESGTAFEQNLLGARSIDTIDPENIEAILSTNFNDYSLGLRSPTFKTLLGRGISTQDGTAWRFSRNLLLPQFASNRRQTFDQIKKCVQGIIGAVPRDGIVDLQPLCFRLTFETTLFLLFGDSVSAAGCGQDNGQESYRLLARHQRVLDRLRTEVERMSGLGASAPEPTREQLKQMSYLNLVIKEVLRLYPSVPVNCREAVRLTTLPVGGGPYGRSPVLVQPSEGVGYCVYAMHRCKDIYGQDADQFRPERWGGRCAEGHPMGVSAV
ncbi:hypothetical protein ACJ41O_001063 [Fusarium nematophilum]